MQTFSILFIENRISIAVKVTQIIGQFLETYRLSIDQNIAHAVAETGSFDVILLGVSQLANEVNGGLSTLTAVYPDVPIILLSETSLEIEEMLFEALSKGASDYVTLSKAGLLALGRRLVRLQGQIQADQVSASDKHAKVITGDTSPLAIQFIGLDHSIHLWNRAAELQVLLETNRQISGHLELLPVLEKIVEETKTLLNADNCRVYFLEKEPQILEPVLSIGPMVDQAYLTPIPVGQGTIGVVAASGKAAIANFAVDGNKTLAGQHGQLLCVPLATLYEMIGVMVVTRVNKAPFSEDDLRFSKGIAQQVSSTINNARLFEETQHNLNELAILYEAGATISTARDTQTVLNTLIRNMALALDVSHGYIVSWDKTQGTGIIQAEFLSHPATMGPKDERGIGLTFSLTERPALRAMINQQQPIVLQLSDPNLDKIERSKMSKYGCFSRLLVPLVMKSETIGWAELWETNGERAFTANEIRLARTLSNQAAVALENVQYLKQTQQALEETAALYQVASALASTQDSQTIMSVVLQEYLRALDLKQGSVIIFDFDTKFGVVKVNFQDEQPALRSAGVGAGERYSRSRWEGQQIPLRNNPIYEQLMRTHQPVVVKEVQGGWSPAASSIPSELSTPQEGGWGGPEALSLVVIPIEIREEIIGVLVAEATRYKRMFNKWETSLGQAMADQLGMALQNVELYELEYQRRQQAETLREVSLVVGSSLNLNEVLERILDQLGRVVKYDSAAIHLIEGTRRRIIAGRGFPNPKKIVGLSFPVNLSDDDDPSSVVIQTHQPLVVGNVPAIYHSFRKTPNDPIKSWMGIPLVARDKVIGLISIEHPEIEAYDEEDIQLALAFANQVAIALENARLYEIEVREIERELEIAQSIQETLLPQFVPKVAGLQISGRILPARQIGGDFFHFFAIGKDQLGVAIGDVSGKGIPAALYMAVAITAIDAQIRVDLAPGELLNKLNYILYHRLQENKMNIGLQVATFAPLPPTNNKPVEAEAEPVGMVMTVASAGMIAPIGATRHGCDLLPVSGLPVGALPPPELTYHDNVFVLDPFTTIIFSSDGIVEAQNEARELFGFERLEAAINEVIDTRDAEIIADYIINTAQKFVGQAEQNDDMTVVVVVKT